MAEIDLIDLTEATLNQIAKWVRQFKLPGRLVDLFESGKIKKNQELLKFAQQVLDEASSAGSCSISMGPGGKGSVGSGGSNGPMDIMASEYADVIGSVHRVGILLRIFLTRPWPVL
jgi:hypothetical protein